MVTAPLISVASIGTQITEAFAGLDRIRELRDMERRRMRLECEAAVLTANERGDDDAIRRAIHELEKGSKP
jgi:hypothetical protein